jgi:hypothetical protein
MNTGTSNGRVSGLSRTPLDSKAILAQVIDLMFVIRSFPPGNEKRNEKFAETDGGSGNWPST